MEELIRVDRKVFTELYGVVKGTCMNKARYEIYMKKSSNELPSIKVLSLTDQNFMDHTLRAHLQVMLWKEADQKHTPTFDITK